MLSKIVFISPNKYVQGEGVIEEIGTEVAKIANQSMLIADDIVWDIAGEAIQKSFGKVESSFHFEKFNGEASTDEIKRLSSVAASNGAEAIIGVGGGKTIDTAKGVADDADIPVIIVPTIASTDAPTSALSVIYSEEGVFEDYRPSTSFFICFRDL